MPSTTTSLCQAKASYKKASGLLELTTTHLQWTPTGKQAPALRLKNGQIASLFCSKQGSEKLKMKLALFGDDAGHTFTFLSPQATANEERERFKKEITNIMSVNRSSANASPTPLAKPAVHNAARPAASTSRSGSVVSDRASILPSGPIDDYRIRKNVLKKTPGLATLHRELVLTGQITENEFWEGREHLLLAEAAQESQKRGRPGQLVDPRPETTVSGEVKIVITPQLVHDIFEEYPVVAKAYNETVPGQLSEAEFWRRYFQSKLFNSHRASIRSTATQHVVKEDPIFDKYVEKADDDLVPRRQRDDDVELLVNLVTTEEDHVETGNQKDLTMQPGKQRGALPLIRRFNEHSERLLNAAEGTHKRPRLEGTDTSSYYYSQIDLEDLHDNDSSAGIILEMQDRDRYFDGRTSTAHPDSAADRPPFRSLLPEVKAQVGEWASALQRLHIEKKAGDAALQSMTRNVHARLEVKLRKNDIPENLFRQMMTCQTAANEFLRQFWSSIHPQQSDFPTSSSNNAAAKAAKAARMAGYLEKTPDKINAIIQTARHEGVDPVKIETAMKPVRDAIEKAIQFYRNRKPTR